MKEFSSQLSKQIKYIKPGQHLKRQKEEKAQKRTIDDEIQHINRQLENGAKMLAVIEEEHRKVTSLIANAKDPSYIYEVEKQISDVQKQTEAVKKENRKLKHEAKGHGKELAQREAVYETDDKVKAVEFQLKEIAVTKAKLKKLKEEMSAFKQVKKVKEERLENAEYEYCRLVEEREEYPIPEENLVRKFQELKKKLENLEEEDRYREKTRDFQRQQMEQALEELILMSIRDKEHMQRLDKMFAEQLVVIQKLSKEAGVEVALKTVHSSHQNNVWSRLHSHSPISSITEGINSEGFTTTTNSKTTKNKELKAIVMNKAKNNIYKDLPIYHPVALKPVNSTKARAGIQTKLKSRTDSVDFDGRNSSVVGGSFNVKDPVRNQPKSTNLSMIEGQNNKRILDESPQKNKNNKREDSELPSLKPNLFKKQAGGAAARRNSSNGSLEDIKADTTVKTPENVDKEEIPITKPQVSRRESTSISPLKSDKPRTPLKLPSKIDTEDKLQPITSFGQKGPESRPRESLSLPQSKSTAIKGLPLLKDENFKPKYIPTQETPSEGLRLPVVDINSKSTAESKSISTGKVNEHKNPVISKKEDSQEFVFNNMDRRNKARRGGPSISGHNEDPAKRLPKAQDLDELFPTNLPEVRDKKIEKKIQGGGKGWQDNLAEVSLGSGVLDQKESKRDRSHLLKKESEKDPLEDDLFVPRNERKTNKLNIGEDDFSFGGLNRLGNKTPGLNLESDSGLEANKIKRMRIGGDKPKVQ